MKLGAYTACLQDRPAARGPEDPAGARADRRGDQRGRVRAVAALPIEELRPASGAREAYLGLFDQAGITLTGLNVQRQPAEPGPRGRPEARRGPAPGDRVRRRCSASSASSPCPGCPARDAGRPVPLVVGEPLGQPVPGRPGLPVERGRDPVLEGHPGPGPRRRREGHASRCTRTTSSTTRARWNGWPTEINATHMGAEMDPSHLFWQGIDPVAAIKRLGDLVYHAAAKDTRINEQNCRVYGVLDDRFGRVPADENPVGPGREEHADPLAGRRLVGLRRGRARPRPGLLGRVPHGAGRRRPGDGGQHRARGPGTGPDRGTAAGGGEPQGRRRDRRRLSRALPGQWHLDPDHYPVRVRFPGCSP